MATITGPRPVHKATVTSVTPVEKAITEPQMDMAQFGMTSDDFIRHMQKAQRMEAAIGNAERPSNLWYRMTGQASYWYMYALMDWYKSEVSVFSTIIHRSASELFRYGLDLKPRFVRKCEECGYEAKTDIDECPQCHSLHMRRPDASQKEYFRRPNGKSFLEEANDNGQTLTDVLKSYAMLQYQDNQAYTVAIMGDIYNSVTGRLERAYPLEFISVDPKFVKYLYDDTGKPGTKYAFTRDNRNFLINLEEDEETVKTVDEKGLELYPAYWQVGNNYGGTGKYWLYGPEEVYQDHWFAPTMIYGVPHGYDIEDDLLAYNYMEKHNLKKWKFGYVRKMVILPGFSDEDVEDITKGIQDVLATNDNSIPIVCTPPQMPGVAEMQAQVLELGTDSAQDFMVSKDDIRDRLCAHWGVPNMFVGDVEASGGMNNESQQITVYDRYLMEKYEFIDRQCDWIMSMFPAVTDWVLRVERPAKALKDAKRFMDELQKAQALKQLGFDIKIVDGEIVSSEEPIDQVQRRQQEQMQQAMMEQQQMMGGAPMDGGLLPGDGSGPPEQGTARREDGEIGGSKDEVDLSKRESDESMEV